MACTSIHRSLVLLSLASRSIALFSPGVCSQTFAARYTTIAPDDSSSRSYYHLASPSVLPRRPSALSSLCAIQGGYQNNNFSSVSHSNALPNFSLPSTIIEERHTDVTVALMSVFAACRVTRHVQPTSSNNIETISKQDASPVTVGDFASQALALQILHRHFPFDMFIAEEGSEALQQDYSLLNKVWTAVNHVQEGIFDTKEEILNAIDYGQGVSVVDNNQQSTVNSRKRRVWCLDPIDGTKGFLRGRVEGGQFCIALALLENGEPVISVLGCPNLPLPSTQAASAVPYGIWSEHEVQDSLKQNTMFTPTRGSMFVAIRGNGCYEIPLHQIEIYLLGESTESTSTPVEWKQLRVTPNDGSSKPLTQAKFCLGEFAAVKYELIVSPKFFTHCHICSPRCGTSVLGPKRHRTQNSITHSWTRCRNGRQ